MAQPDLEQMMLHYVDTARPEAPLPIAEELTCNSYFDSLQNRTVYLFADQRPEYPGGTQAMFKFIAANFVYPDTVNNNAVISSKVFLSFIVEPDGTISNKAVRRSINLEFDQAALRVIDKMPVWIPGRCDGVSIPFVITIPINICWR
jgi:periplasmic protein TonB